MSGSMMVARVKHTACYREHEPLRNFGSLRLIQPEAQRPPRPPVDTREDSLHAAVVAGAGVPRDLDQIKPEFVMDGVQCAIEGGVRQKPPRARGDKTVGLQSGPPSRESDDTL